MFTALSLLALAVVQQPTTADAHVAGTFDVTVAPNAAVTGSIGLLALSKTYHGGLDGTGSGQMLGAGDPGGGTASYVALEQVTGTLAGRSGSFVLQHQGAMHGGQQEMQVRIAPGSGTGALSGISGTMTIRIDGAVHRYDLRYRLPR